MGFVLRGLRAVALLAGFYALLAVILAVLVVLDVASIAAAVDGSAPATDWIRGIPVLLLITAVAGLAAYRACTVSTRMRPEEFGVPVDPAAEPRLAARVARLAEVAGTRPPDEIWIINAVNAAVAEEGRLLGLIAGKRRMLIGAPLLLTLTPAQLDAVLAHELGHYSNRDTRFTPVIGRGRLALQAALGSTGKGRRRTRTRGGRVRTVSPVPGQTTLFRLLAAYAKLFFRITQADARRAEYAADRYSALVAGREAAASALGALTSIGTVYSFFLGRYVSSGVDLGLVPSAEVLYRGFAELLEQPERQRELAELRAEPERREGGKYDSHPPIPERIAAIMALPETAVRQDVVEAADEAAGGVRAVSILDHQGALLSAAAAKMLAEQPGKRQVDWPELVGAAAHAHDVELAEQLRGVVTSAAGRIGSLDVLLDLVESGHAPAVYRPTGDQRKMGPAQRERVFRRFVWAWFVVELETQGRATRRLSWTEFEAVDMDPELRAGLEEGLETVVRAAKGEAAAEPETVRAAAARLRELLKVGGQG